jgi:hypothetical protein
LTIVISSGLSCGGGDSGKGSSATGTIRGTSVPTNDVIAVVAPPAGGVATVQILYANFGSACGVIHSEFSGGPEHPSVVGLSLALQAAGTTVPSGTYPIGGQSPGQAVALFDTTDSNCATVVSTQATSGTIAYGPVSASTIQGNFDVSFGSDRVTGHFIAPVCILNSMTPPRGCGH